MHPLRKEGVQRVPNYFPLDLHHGVHITFPKVFYELVLLLGEAQPLGLVLFSVCMPCLGFSLWSRDFPSLNFEHLFAMKTGLRFRLICMKPRK